MKGTPLRAAIAGMLLAGLSAGAQAHIHDVLTVDFEGLTTGAISGNPNLAPGAGGVCPGAACYQEDGVLIGVVNNPTPEAEHLHRTGTSADRKLSYHADSTGIYLRAKDGHEFALLSLDFDAAISDENPGDGVDDVWEILGFNTAVNPDLTSGDGTNYATRVAYQTVANGTVATGATPLLLDPSFQWVNAVWIHYKGFPAVPGTNGLPSTDFALVIDNVKVGPAVEPVPLPAAVWMMGPAVVALGALRRRRSPA